MTRGVVGHEALEVFYNTKKRGLLQSTAVKRALAVVDSGLAKYPTMTKELTHLKEVLKLYFIHYENEPFTVVETETMYDTVFDNSIENVYGMRLDMLVKYPNGDYVLIDHKFVYDFYTDKVIKVNPQMLKYIATLKANGIHVKKFMYNQIRYRSVTVKVSKQTGELDYSGIFVRSFVIPSTTKITNTVKQHAKVANQISALMALPKEEHLEAATMNQGMYSCDKCSYWPLCEDMLEGRNHTNTMKVLYVQNDYGYN